MSVSVVSSIGFDYSRYAGVKIEDQKPNDVIGEPYLGKNYPITYLDRNDVGRGFRNQATSHVTLEGGLKEKIVLSIYNSVT